MVPSFYPTPSSPLTFPFIPLRESPPLLDDEDLLALASLLRVPQSDPHRNSTFPRVLFNVCAHTRSRRMLLRMLLAMVRCDIDGFTTAHII